MAETVMVEVTVMAVEAVTVAMEAAAEAVMVVVVATEAVETAMEEEATVTAEAVTEATEEEAMEAETAALTAETAAMVDLVAVATEPALHYSFKSCLKSQCRSTLHFVSLSAATYVHAWIIIIVSRLLSLHSTMPVSLNWINDVRYTQNKHTTKQPSSESGWNLSPVGRSVGRFVNLSLKSGASHAIVGGLSLPKDVEEEDQI